MNGIATVVPDDSVALPFKDLIAFGLDTLPIGVRSATNVAVAKSKGYGKLFRHPTAVRRGIGGFRVA